MDYQESIDTLREDIRCVCYREQGLCGICVTHSLIERDNIINACKIAIFAMQELQEYHKTGLTAKQVEENIYELSEMKRVLGHYQQLGTLEEVREAVERKQAKEPKIMYGMYGRVYLCRKCGNELAFSSQYCPFCGQKQEWE